MRFVLPGRSDSFDIPDDWWATSNMESFVRLACSYTHQNDKKPIALVALAKIKTPRRSHNLGYDFNRERMISILCGIRQNVALPAVGVELMQGTAPFKYKLYCGFHRFHASVAAGFSHVPTFTVELV